MKLGDIDLGYTDAGTGLPVVLLHGLAEDRTSWSPQLGQLKGYRLLAVDLRGHGETTLGEPEGTLAQLSRDFIRLLEAETGPATAVGFSLGGTIVLQAAIDRPDLVQHPIVLATSSVVGRRAREFFEERIRLAESGDHEALFRALKSDTAAQVVTDVDLDELTKWRMDAIGDARGYINAARAMLGVADDPLTSELTAIKAETDVIGASEDVFCPRKAADILLDALPQATYHEVEGAGHLMNVDRPDAVTTALEHALNRRKSR